MKKYLLLIPLLLFPFQANAFTIKRDITLVITDQHEEYCLRDTGGACFDHRTNSLVIDYTLSPYQLVRGFKWALFHELGHCLLDDVADTFPFDPITMQGEVNNQENVAETFAYFMSDMPKFTELYPERWVWLMSYFGQL